MNYQFAWFLLHVVGPITLVVVILGVIGKAFKVLFPQGYDTITTRMGTKVGAVVGSAWHFFFLTDEQKKRLDIYDTTGMDPDDPHLVTHTAAENGTTDGQPTPADPSGQTIDDIPAPLLDRFAQMYGD